MLFFRLSPHCTRNGARIFYDYTASARYSHSSRLALTGKHAIFNFFYRLSPSTHRCLFYSVSWVSLALIAPMFASVYTHSPSS